MRGLWKFMTPTERTAAWVLLLAMLAGMLGCQPTSPDPPDININIDIVNNAGQPQASPSPEAGGPVARVGIGKVAETCPANVQPSGRGDAVRVACTAFLTCSPFDAKNIELFDPAIIGTAPESFGLVSGDAVSVSPHGSNAFNLDATGVKAGTSTFGCKVKGVQSSPFVLAVVP